MLNLEPGLAAGGGVAIGIFLGWLFAKLRFNQTMTTLKVEAGKTIAGLQTAVSSRDTAYQDVSRRLEDAGRQNRGLQFSLSESLAKLAAAEEKISAVGEMRTSMADTYRSVSARALAENNRVFLDLAKTAMAKYLDTAKMDFSARGKAVEKTIQPIADALDRYDRHIQAMERSREKAYGGLSQQVRSLAMVQNELHKETGKLVKALRLPHVRGRWGEMTLRRVVELSGMQNRCDFYEQTTSQTENGLQRPDMIIQLPDGRQIVVDAKVPFTAYLDAIEAEDETARSRLYADHAGQIKQHILKLAQKNYWKSFQPSPEFVVLFIPGENFFSAALSQMPDLIEIGAGKGVIVSTPTTLIALLKAVASGWRRHEATENAEAVSELGGELYRRLATMTQYIVDLGRDLERSVAGYNKMVGSYDRRVMVTARKLENCGVVGPDDKVAETPQPLEIQPRHLSPE
ncbi:MAG: DNA recombination protein RmuC [Desulfobacteraceae bacterium]|nr:DNA recombination protein RmuC [Desulfobacteraceae bacterium]